VRAAGWPHAEAVGGGGVSQHGGGVVGADQDEGRPADALGDLGEVDAGCLGHGPGAEGGDLVLVLVGRAHEAGGVQGFADPYDGRVDSVCPQPGVALGEVPAGRADQDRVEAEDAETEGDVGGDAASVHVESVCEERQGDALQLILEQLLGEASGEHHQVVGRYGSGHDDTHGTCSLDLGTDVLPAARRQLWPTALRRASARSVRSQVKSGSSRPKWP
jgi:hypothetical protein